MSGDQPFNAAGFGGAIAPPVDALSPGLIWVIFFLSVTAILLGNFVGSAGAAVFLALWLMLALADGRKCVNLIVEGPLALWALPLLAVASTLWSQSPTETMKFSLEFVATATCAVLAASLLQPRALISALTACLVVIGAVCVALGKNSVDPLTGASAFVGVFESKNQLGFFSSLMLLTSIALLIDSGQSWLARLMGLAAVILALPLLAMTRSGTAIVSAVIACVVLLGNLMLSRLSRFGRTRLLFAVFVSLVPALFLIVVAGDQAASLLLAAMGKDATLTGRTVLWQHGRELISHHPLLGYGYQAFWRHDTVEAESLWHEFHVDSRQGFHFHSTYVETAIELGYLGATVLVVIMLSVCRNLIRWSWRTGSVAASFFTALMFCLLTRSFVEVDVLLQFQIGSFVFFVAATCAARNSTGDRT